MPPTPQGEELDGTCSSHCWNPVMLKRKHFALVIGSSVRGPGGAFGPLLTDMGIREGVL